MTKPLKTLSGGAMTQAAEYTRQSWHVVVDDDVSLADILVPAFWAHHAQKVKPGALIDVVNHDYSLDVTLRVLAAGIGFVKVRAIRVHEDAEVVAERTARAAEDAGDAEKMVLPEQYKITATGRGGFTVTYVPNDAKIATGKKTRADAVAVAKEHAANAGIAWPEATPVEIPAGA